ncbi:hypothetical protein WA1_50440 [Scytonema hofmannii PCC 7110]|uniref:Uncharacterized protein n=1 Tax=Scytonema hofmannii PCC 7110 TaxID=128403 RepID=A0A139WQE0_9CYAN|nr:hypothetical protein WA1_50440 [Scytonema hofmannii PCC 7110]
MACSFVRLYFLTLEVWEAFFGLALFLRLWGIYEGDKWFIATGDAGCANKFTEEGFVGGYRPPGCPSPGGCDSGCEPGSLHKSFDYYVGDESDRTPGDNLVSWERSEAWLVS